MDFISFLSINGGSTMIFHFEGNGSHKVPSAVPRAPSVCASSCVCLYTHLLGQKYRQKTQSPRV